MAGHAAGEPFLLVEARALKAIAGRAAAIGSVVTVTAYGPGNDGAGAGRDVDLQGEAARPLSPAHLRGPADGL